MSHTGDEYENPVSGERGVVRLGSDDTDGRSVLVDLYLRPGGGPNEHVHSYLHETFEVLGGRVGFRLNGREEITGPGRRLEVPPGVVHDFWNADDEEAHVLGPGRAWAPVRADDPESGGAWPPQATPTRGARPSRCCGWRCSPRSSSGRSSWSRRHAGCSGCCSRCLRRSAVRVATRRPIPATWS